MTDSTPPDHAEVFTFPPVIPASGIGLGWLLDRYVLDWPLAGTAGGNETLASAAWVLLGVATAVFAFSLWPFWKTRQNPEPHTPTNALYTQGIYRFSRNPIYLGFLLVQTALGLYWNNGWILLLVPACAWVLHTGIIKPEEVYLERLFGDEYRRYKSQVRRWL